MQNTELKKSVFNTNFVLSLVPNVANFRAYTSTLKICRHDFSKTETRLNSVYSTKAEVSAFFFVCFVRNHTLSSVISLFFQEHLMTLFIRIFIGSCKLI